MADENTQPDEAALTAAVEAEGDAIDQSTLPDGLRPEPAPEPVREPQGISQEQYDALMRENEALRAAQQQAQPEPVPQLEGDDLEDLWFTDPKRAAEQIRQQVKDELRQEYQTQDQAKQFWADFNRENPALAGHNHIVNAVMNQHWDEVKALSGKTGRDKIAELVKAELVSLIPQKTEPKEDTTLETPSVGSAPVLQAVPSSNEPQSISALLRHRATQRATKTA